MAVDNLNYYSSGLPAGQQTDKYSSQPGCLKSKNLDIFSSSKSVKATAWSAPTTTDSDIIKQDGKLILKTDGKVYERNNGADTLIVDPSTNFVSFDVCYTGYNGTYAPAIWGTPQDMSVKYEGDDWKSFIVFTDRSSYLFTKTKFVFTKTFDDMSSSLQRVGTVWSPSVTRDRGYRFEKTSNTANTASLTIKIDNASFSKAPLRIFAEDYASDNCTISLNKITVYQSTRFYYDAQLDGMTPDGLATTELPFTGSITTDSGVTVEVPTVPYSNGYTLVMISFKWTEKAEGSGYDWSHGNIFIDMNGGPRESWRLLLPDESMSDGDNDYYYSYLPLRERKLVDIGSYAYSSSYWMKGTSFQPLYKWEGTWMTVEGDKRLLYDFVQDMGWESDTAMDVVGISIWNEQAYMIGNLDGNGYIIPCDLTGGRGVPFIAYGCTFKAVTNIDYLLYLVGEDRGVSILWVFNQQELVPIMGGKIEAQYTDLIGVDETYKFNGDLINWRKNLILSTTDNRIFQYGQTYGGKGGAFIHELPAGATLNEIIANGNDLELKYSVTNNNVTTTYLTKYQDDTPIKRYNSEWSAVYPIILGNHLLEKEESDLYASYILPSSSCSLEFWGMANHYHFWTFTSSDNATLSTTADYKLKGATGTYSLKFLERNDDQYTFKLEGNLPVQSTSEMKITDSNNTEVLSYTSFNHFRKIGEITTDGYVEGEFRFHNLNNKLELPKSHSLQIMVKGKGTTDYTPELFALDLVANQRDRG